MTYSERFWNTMQLGVFMMSFDLLSAEQSQLAMYDALFLN